MLTKVGSLSGGFGSFQKEVRLNGRLYLGVGHTPAEAHRNAWDAVEVSPSCTEGVDLKDDLCRWQVLTAVPYPPAGSGFYQRLLSKGGWLTYNTHTLRQIMQMLGRPVRSKTDHAVSYMADTRFNGFIQKMWKNIPQWLRDGFVPYER